MSTVSLTTADPLDPAASVDPTWHESFQNPSLPAAIEVLRALQVVATALEEGVNAELQTQGLSNVPVELHTAVAALLGNPALIARWRAGRPLTRTGVI